MYQMRNLLNLTNISLDPEPFLLLLHGHVVAAVKQVLE